MIAPCKDCQERTVGCHSSCDKYLAFRAERDALNAALSIEYAADIAYREGVRRVSKSHHQYKRNGEGCNKRNHPQEG